MNEKMKKIQEMEQKIRNLEADLSSTSSEIGDWKIAKCMEYQVNGLEAPYDLEELHKKRQDVRDEINQLQEQIETLKSEVYNV